MAKKKSSGNIVLSIITMVVGALTCLGLFLNVWNFTNSSTYVDPVAVGGYFEDMSTYETMYNIADVSFLGWASTIAGIAVIVALCATALYIVCALVNMVTKGNKLMRGLCKLASIVMLLAGVVALVCSIIFIIPKITVGSNVTKMAFGIGSWFGFACPIVAGLIGLANK